MIGGPVFCGLPNLPDPLNWNCMDQTSGCPVWTEDHAITYFTSLSAAGFVATAISFGPARMGFGLFVPDFRSAFSMTTSTVGFVSSLGFTGFFIGLLAAQWMLSRQGPAAPVLFGLAAASVGLATVAMAPNVIILAAGVFLATSRAGFAWTPFNDAVHRKIEGADCASAFSEISSGTSLGIFATGLAALWMVYAGISWRLCWLIFAIAALIGLACNFAILRQIEKMSPATRSDQRWTSLLQPVAAALFAIAFVFGATSAIYIAFAVDYMAEVGGIPGLSNDTIPALVFVFYGLFGLTGLLTARLQYLTGLPWLIRSLMLAGALSLTVIAISPGSWAGLILSAGLQGVHLMGTSAVLALWSEQLFPALPSFSFTAALPATAAGNVLGPALAGLASTAFGAPAMFLTAAALPAITLVALLGRRHCVGDPNSRLLNADGAQGSAFAGACSHHRCLRGHAKPLSRRVLIFLRKELQLGLCEGGGQHGAPFFQGAFPDNGDTAKRALPLQTKDHVVP